MHIILGFFRIFAGKETYQRYELTVIDHLFRVFLHYDLCSTELRTAQGTRQSLLVEQLATTLPYLPVSDGRRGW